MKLAWRFLKQNRKHLDKTPVMVEQIGWAIDKGLHFPVLVLPILKANADALTKLAPTIDMVENVAN
jgi:hypothetical protein